MGIEYRISFSPDKIDKLRADLHRFGGHPAPEKPDRFYFSFSDHAESRPDATVILETNTVYFCDHGGNREKVAFLFRRIVDEALAYSDHTDSIVITGL
jgi:hypothetical protein